MAETSGTIMDERGNEVLTFGRQGFGSIDGRSNGWWGTMTLLATEAALFVYLLFSYYYMAFHYGRTWLPAELPSFTLSGPSTVILITSSLTAWMGERSVKKDSRGGAVLWLVASLLLGAVFMGIQLKEWSDKPFMIDTDSYGSLYFTVTGFHMAHVAVGLLVLLALTVWTAVGKFDSRRRDPVSIGVIYWHFVDAVWLTVFFTFYVTTHLFQP
ncbi:cytochrome c oxidase subunit 3 [Tranquillimonas alkanivorans]|uniref:Cytochrome c oxidase subunit 3 n=1 Tax=Tranquillimonas alkanivorans TaxID=441119 RepID=A0A1I5RSF8_9RHOB|nr:cytochrome c oxidase subunit 3 [Tranquillimonas alkanivorans]SFP61191.1 cytochrome c oxidase subunit 3 [Tranquillimonas alkanivorans]